MWWNRNCTRSGSPSGRRAHHLAATLLPGARPRLLPGLISFAALTAALPGNLGAQVPISISAKVKTTLNSFLCVGPTSGGCGSHAIDWQFYPLGFTPVSPLRPISPLVSDPGHTVEPLFAAFFPADMNGDGWLDLPYRFTTSSLRDVGVYEYLLDCIFSPDLATEYPCTLNTMAVDVFNSSPAGTISISAATEIGRTVTLNANSNDPDGGGVNNFWRFVTAPATRVGSFGSPTSGSTTLNFVDERDIGSWTVAVDVDDNEGERRSFTRSFSVPNIPPSISIDGETEVPALGTISLASTETTDEDGGPPLVLTWDILAAPTGATRAPQSNFSNAPSIGWVTTETDIGTWRFRLTARDNENATDAAEVEVRVTNLEPVITLDRPAPYFVSQGTTFTLTNTTPADPDGGVVIHDWELIQSPVGAGATLGSGFAPSPTLTLTTNAAAAGTWIWLLTMRDNEGAEDTQEVKLLVDAPVQAAVTGPATQNQVLGFVVDGTGSNDPDSPGPSVPGRGHQTSRGSVDLSPGIVSYAWSFVDIPVEAWGRYVTGPIEYSLDAANGGPTLTLEPFDLRPGTWTFSLHVIDGEGNEDEAEFSVLVLEPNTRPIALLPTVAYGLTDIAGNIVTDIGTNAQASFDLDNIITSPYSPGLGITNYAWQIVGSPPLCTAAVTTPSGAGAATFTLFPAGTAVGPQCVGTWLTRVTVTDDEPAPTTLTGTGDGAIVMANCPNEVCIDYPTTAAYQYVEFADNTDVTIVYHLNSALYTNPIFGNGARLELSVFHESDLATAVYTGQFDYDVLSVLLGGRPTVHWSGYTQAGLRPRAGKYTVRLRVTNPLLPTPFSEAVQPLSIWLEVVDVAITAATTDRFVSTSGLQSGADRFHLDFSVTGHFATSASYDQAKLRVTSVATGTTVANVDIPSPLSRTVNWDGELVPGSGTYLPPGEYRADIEILKLGHSLGRSPPVTFTAYGVTIEVVGAPPGERWTPGALFVVGGPPRDVKVAVVPTPTTGNVTVVTTGTAGAFEFKDGAASVATGGAGASFPAAAFAAPKTFQVRALLPSPTATELRALYLPAGTAPAKMARDSAQLLGLDVQLAAMCSDTVQAFNPGVFVERLPAVVSAANFSEMRLLMRPLRVQADRILDPAATDVILDIESGGPNVALFDGGVTFTPLGASKTWHAADFDPGTQKLDVPVLLGGLLAGEATLRLRYFKGATEIKVRRVKVRVGDLPGLAGRPTGVAPQFLYGRVFNTGEALRSALDPSRLADRVGRSAAVYVMPHRTRAGWAASNTLAGAVAGPIAVTIAAGGTSANVSALGAALPTGDYDVVYDFGSCPLTGPFTADGTFDPGDLNDVIAVDAPSVSVMPSALAVGPSAVTSAEYGVVAPITTTAVPAGYDGLVPDYLFRLRGKLVFPSTLPPGTHPLVVIAHGNHAPLDIPSVGLTPATITSDENYRGYTYLQNHLASHGYITLSVDLDEMYGGGGTLPDIFSSGILLRGNVILRNINEVLTNAAIAGGALVTKIDKSHIYLVGHSRGGEAILTALDLYSGALPRPPASPAYVSGLTFRGLVSVSPVSRHSVRVPATIPLLLIYGSADGDVNGASPGVQPFVHVDRARGATHTIYAIGANHNHFNQSWAYSDATHTVTCPMGVCGVSAIAPVGASLLSRANQEQLLSSYVFAFLMRYDRSLGPWEAYFSTPPSILRPLGAPAVPLTGSTKRAVGSAGLTVVDDYESSAGHLVASSGAAVAATALSGLDEVDLSDIDLITETDPENRFFQATTGGVFHWSGASSYEFTPTAALNLNGATVAFRVSQQPRHTSTTALGGRLDFAVTLSDGVNTSSVTSGAWDTIFEVYTSTVPGLGETTKGMLETRAIPWWAFAANGSSINLANVTSIRFEFGIAGTSPQGRVAIDDLEIWR